MAGSEDNPTDGFAFPDHAGDGRCGHDPVLPNDQASHLRKCHTGVFVSWLPSKRQRGAIRFVVTLLLLTATCARVLFNQ